MRLAARRVALAVVLLVPAVAWPGIEDPFSTPRVVVLCGGTALLALLLVAGRMPAPAGGPRTIAVMAWLAVLGLSGALAPVVHGLKLLHEIVVVIWAVALVWAAPDDEHVLGALILSSAFVAAWAVLQWLNLDPWRAFGWAAPPGLSARMRVFATLGNPNHVGALLATLLPAAVLRAQDPRRRWIDIGALVVIALGIAATGSRGALLGAGVGVAYLLVRSTRSARASLGAMAVVAALAMAIVLGPARGLGETMRGRVYIWRVAAPHLLDHPLTGWGPGSFAAVYPLWEAARIEQGVDEDVRKFAAAQMHAHNDYVERLVELGLPGLIVWCGLVGWVLAGPAGAPRTGAAAAAAAGVAALAAVSLVDFPLQRMVQRFTWWTLAAVATGLNLRGIPSKRS